MYDFNWKDPFLLSEQLGEEEKLIQETASRIATIELSPLLQTALNGKELDREGYELIGQAGLFGITLPQEYGGSNASHTSY